MDVEFGRRQKKLPAKTGVLLGERLVRLFELKTWREINVVLLYLYSCSLLKEVTPSL